MVQGDTSVWMEHLRRGMPELAGPLDAASVIGHPFVLGELACGNLKNRDKVLRLLQTLYTCPVASHEEILSFIEANHPMGRGLGHIDAHLLASAKLSGIPLWTLDRSLKTSASRLNLAYGHRGVL